jgi:20S proteasome alpha/beta subunit
MVCRDGIVMAADSEQSGFYRKSNVPKLETYDSTRNYSAQLSGATTGCSVIIAGAGNGELADYASHRIAREAAGILSINDVETKLEGILEDIFGKKFPVYSSESLGEFRLLIAIKAPDFATPKLFSTYGATLVERKKFVLGSGTLVDYVLDQIYAESMTTEDGMVAALALLQIAKKYVDGVGGDSKVAVLSKDGDVTQKPGWEVTEEENILGKHSKIANDLMLAMMRTRADTEEQWTDNLGIFCKAIGNLREEKKKSDQKIIDIRKYWTDYFRKEQEEREKEKSKLLPYLVDKPAKNLFNVEGNVFSGKSVPGAKFVGKLSFKQA